MRVSILGGGVAALAAAYYLGKEGIASEIYEAGPQLGGLASSLIYNGYPIDRYYHCSLPEDTRLHHLMEELGIGDRIYWKATTMGFMYAGQCYSMATPLDLLKFKPLSLWNRLRFGLTAIYGKLTGNFEKMEGVTACEWLTRVSGRSNFEMLWEPLLRFKFGDRFQEVPAVWFLGRLSRQGSARSKKVQGEAAAHFRGGLKIIVDSLVEQLRKMDCVIRLKTKVDGIEITNGRVSALKINGQTQSAEAVISTLPFPLVKSLIKGQTGVEELEKVNVEYQGVRCFLLLLRHSLIPHYWMPIVNSNVSFSGLVETTNLIPPELIGDMHLVYLMNYLSQEELDQPFDAEASKPRILRELKQIFPQFNGSWVIDSFFFSARHVEPIITLNHSKKIPKVSYLDDTLLIADTSRAYPRIVCVDSATCQGWNAAQVLLHKKQTAMENSG
jgi:protoporphyrinogen oxidase